MTEPARPTPPPRPPLVRCTGRVHRWLPDFEFGDTCACGAFYLFRDRQTDGMAIEEAELDD